LGAIVGFFLPWFVFVAAVSLGCRAPLQIEIYDLYGAGLALGGAGAWPTALAIVALLCAVLILILAALSLRRPRRRRIHVLLALSLVGLAALSVLGALSARGQVTPLHLLYVAYLGFGSGFWVTMSGLLLAWIGGVVLHAAVRQRTHRAPVREIVLALLGIVGLLSASAAAIVIRPSAYPSLTCVHPDHTPLPGGKTVYDASADTVYALDAASGQTNWSCHNPLGGVVTAGAPALASGALIVASRDGYVYALRASDATLLWRADVGGRGQFVTSAPLTAPIVADGLIYGVNGAGAVYALRVSDGKPLWAPSTARPTVWLAEPLLLADDALLYLTTGSGLVHLAALDAHTGRLIWQSSDTAIAPYSYPARRFLAQVDQGLVVDEEISAQNQGEYLVARTIADGVTRWRYLLAEPGALQASSAFTISHGMVYLEQRAPVVGGSTGPGAPRVVALAAHDGTETWSTPAPDGAPGQGSQGLQVTLGAAGIGVYLAVSWASGAGVADTIYGIDAQRGAVQWRYDVAPSSSHSTSVGQPDLVIAGASVYLLDPSGTLLDFDARTGVSHWRVASASSSFPWYVMPGDLVTVAPTSGDATTTLMYMATSQLYAINPADGTLRWQFKTRTPTSPYALNFGYLTPQIAPPTLG
jgi:outer membrane protein assembly factor BamB